MMRYGIVVEVTKRIHNDLMITIYLMIMEIIFSDVVYKLYWVEKWKGDEVDPYDMVYHNLPKSILYCAKWNLVVIATWNGSCWRVLRFATDKEKWSCICQMFL
jgi:hypothetical protein